MGTLDYQETASSSFEEWVVAINREFEKLIVSYQVNGMKNKESFDITHLYRVVSSLGLHHDATLLSLHRIVSFLKEMYLEMGLYELTTEDIYKLTYDTLRHLPTKENYFWAEKYKKIYKERKISYTNSIEEETEYRDVRGLKPEIKNIIEELFEPARDILDDSNIKWVDDSITEWVDAWSEEFIDSLRLGWVRSDLSYEELYNAIKSFAVIPPWHWFAEKIYSKKVKEILISISFARNITNDVDMVKTHIDNALNGILTILALQIKFQLGPIEDNIPITSFDGLNKVVQSYPKALNRILNAANIQKDSFEKGFDFCLKLSQAELSSIGRTTINSLSRFLKVVEAIYNYELSKILSGGSFVDMVKYIMKSSKQVKFISKTGREASYLKYEMIDFSTHLGILAQKGVKHLVVRVIEDEHSDIEKMKEIYEELKMENFKESLCVVFFRHVLDDRLGLFFQVNSIMENDSRVICLDRDTTDELWHEPSVLQDILGKEVFECDEFLKSSERGGHNDIAEQTYNKIIKRLNEIIPKSKHPSRAQFNKVLTAIIKFASFNLRTSMFLGSNYSENDFQDKLDEFLYWDLTEKCEREGKSGRGNYDIKILGIPMELKIEKRQTVTWDYANRHLSQICEYTNNEGQRVGILAILDLTPSNLADPNLLNEVSIKSSIPTRGSPNGNERYPTAIIVVIIRGNQKQASSLR